MTQPTLSVLVCTALRPKPLLETLHALAAARAPEAPWELVLVDNRPGKGQTRAVIASMKDALPLVAVDEPQPGLSHARNRAVAAARGELLLFTDDDVSVDEDWLRAYERALRAHPDVAVFGGPIRPVFERATPEWIAAVEEHVPTSFAWLDPEEPVTLSFEEGGTLPFGANFAIRADALSDTPFDPTLGRQPGTVLLGGEETQVIRNLMEAGAKGRWLADAPVTHRIERARMTRAYQRKYWYGVGWAEGVVDATVRTHLDPKWWLPSLEKERKDARTAWRRARWRGPAEWVPVLRDLAMAKGRCESYKQELAKR